MRDPFPPTEEQLAVINDRGHNLLVLAGPGTGKTETLARRFAVLVEGGIAPDRILVLTFSRRASEEMRDRILLRLRQLQGAKLAVSGLNVKTFHSFCARLLDGDGVRSHERALLTPVRERLLWRRLMESDGLALESFEPAIKGSPQFATDCLNVIGQLKGWGISPEQVAGSGDDPRLRDIGKLFAAMERERGRLNLRDFRDLVNEAERELRDAASQASTWLRAAKFAHILVDEFQDSDPMQLRLLERIRAALEVEPFFCFVGDKNQSIYRFRGASPANVDVAGSRFACRRLELHTNRRSAPIVLQAANADPWLDRGSLTEAADSLAPGLVRFVRLRTIEEEVRFIRDAIAAEVVRGTSPQAIAVLLRQTQPYQQLLIHELSSAGVPVAPQPASGFHEDSLIDAVLTTLRTLAAPEDQNSWRRLLCNPIVGFHPVEVQLAFDAGRRNKLSDPRAMVTISAPNGPRQIAAFLDSWRRCHEAYDRATPLELVRAIVRELDLLRSVREMRSIEGFDPGASPARLEALLQAAGDFTEAGAGARHSRTVAEFIERLDETLGLLADATQPPQPTTQGVRVISIHAAKGLEFDVVVVPQLLDGILPGNVRPNRLLPIRSVEALRGAGAALFVDDDEARREEHSLWYVALTRARRKILATAPQMDDDGVELVPSVFAGALERTEGEPHGPVIQEAPAASVDREKRTSSPAEMMDVPIRLPIETLSPTNISTFLICPRRFYYGDVVRLPKREDDATLHGQRLHEILRRFHEIEADFTSVRNPDAAASRYERLLRELTHEISGSQTAPGPLARFEHDDLELRVSQYARALADEANATPFRVIACEAPVSSKLGALIVRGKADRVDELQRGGLVIRDYKSGRLRGALAGALREAFDRLDRHAVLFGDAPKGLNVQTLLYIAGVEEAFAKPVVRVDYLYFRGRSVDNSDLFVDSTQIVDSDDASSEPGTLSRREVARARSDIAQRIVSSCSAGSLRAFPTTSDDQVCMFCDFVRICPGAGAIPA